MAAPTPDSLLTVRAALVLLGALSIGVVAGALSYLAQPNVASACLVGGGAVAAAVLLLNTVVGRA
jgi:hypothetical protein